MMHATLPVQALQQPSAAVAVPVLVERRYEGETFPRIPLGSVELTREQAATGLFLEFERLPIRPTDTAILNALQYAVNTYGLNGLDARLNEVRELSEHDQQASLAYCFAYRLCVEHWYKDALSERISTYMMVSALYASDLSTRSTSAFDRREEINGFLAEGIATLGVEAMVRLSQDAEAEFGYEGSSARVSDAYRAALPNASRRRRCHQIAVNHQLNGPRALMVFFDDGTYAVGVTPPEDPHSTAEHKKLLARLAARKAKRGGAR
ncbi:hypothetical protein [Streptomyces sp. NPDC051561]|uniref:hypothetical protein n=1 Tax=Streptomyces sp. NPDC051561 TaxID=3365658 RepID=UPI00378BE143